MLTRRSLILAAPVLALATVAWARAFTPDELRELQRTQTLTTNEASRLQGLASNFRQLATTHASDATLATRLTQMQAALEAARTAFVAALGAYPASVRPRTSGLTLPPAARVRPRAGPGAGSGGVLTPRAPSVLTPALNVDEVATSTRLRPQVWRDVARGLRIAGGIGGLSFEPTATHYETAATQLQSAKDMIRGISLRAALAHAAEEAESTDRLGNFEIQDLMGSVTRNNTLASDMLKALNDVVADPQRRISG